MRKRFGEIKERPHAGPLVEGFEQHRIRRKLHGSYLIFYRITLERIEIVHVLHGAMDYTSILGDAP